MCGGVAEAVRAAKAAGSGLPVQVEVDRIDQIEPALAAGADRLLLDNMTPDMLREAVALVAGRVPLEASGGVNLDTIRAIAETGVDYISVGRITQSAPGGRHRPRLCAGRMPQQRQLDLFAQSAASDLYGAANDR